MSIEEITREVSRLMRDLLRRDMRPTYLFVDHHTYSAIKRWAKEEAFVLVRTTTGVGFKQYFHGLELYEIDSLDQRIVVAP